MIVNEKEKSNGNITIPPKPESLAPRFDGIPVELKESGRWCLWKYVYRPEQSKPWTKPPLTLSGSFASTTKAYTFTSFDKAAACYQGLAIHTGKGSLEGIGLKVSGNYVGIDIDNCRSLDGTLDQRAKDVLSRIVSYTEISPSGTGLRIIAKSSVPLPKHIGSTKKNGMEIYDVQSPRYLTFTGHRLESVPDDCRDCTAQIAALHSEYWPAPTAKEPAAVNQALGSPAEIADQKVLEVALAATNGEQFQKLWQGTWEGDYESQSSADLALCSLLAFYLGPDPERLANLFAQSGLYRDKWERADYQERTIELALDGKTDFYNWGRQELGAMENELENQLGGQVQDCELMDMEAVTELQPIANEIAELRKQADAVAAAQPKKLVRKHVRRAYDIDEIMAFPPPEWEVRGLLVENSFNVVFGSYGSCKSFFALDLALSIAAGIPFLDKYPTKQGKVSYLAGEGVPGTKKRIWAWAHHKGIALETIKPHFCLCPDTYDMMQDDEADEVIKVVRAKFGCDARHYFFDTMSTYIGNGDVGQNKDVNSYCNVLKRLKLETNASVTTVHHCGKDTSRGSLGAITLPNSADTMIEAKQTEYAGMITFRCEKQKDSEKFETIRLQALKIPVPADIDLVCSDDGQTSGSLVLVEALSGAGFAEIEKPKERLVPFLRLILETYSYDGFTWSEGKKLVEEKLNITNKDAYQYLLKTSKQDGYLIKEDGKEWRLNRAAESVINKLIITET